ncbi:MAG: leucine-rich repeat protein [Ruminococcus sp.]|nr:leucine-rich repeat protein [Ruminococcus sp.]
MKKRTGILLTLCLALLGVLFVNPKGVSAANGPDKSKLSYAYIIVGSEITGVDEFGYTNRKNNYVYLSDNMKAELKEYNSDYSFTTPKGVSYNEKTNTLTLDNYTGNEIKCSSMGDDFTIELKGENTVEMIYVYGDGYGGSLTISGKGILNVKGGTYFKEDNLHGRCGIKLMSESMGSKDVLKITNGATVNVEGDGSSNMVLIGVFQTAASKDGIQLDGVKLNGAVLSTWTDEVEENAIRRDDFGFPSYYGVVKKDGKKYLYCSRLDFSSGNAEWNYVVYSDDNEPKQIETYDTLEAMFAAGYKSVMKTDYGYKIVGKNCTISADSSSSNENGNVIESGNLLYEIKTAGTKKKAGTVYVAGIYDYRKAKSSITIPKTIKVDGISYKVIGIAEEAFMQDNTLEKLVIGANVKYIEKNAFYSAYALKEIVIKSKKLTSKTVGKNAFAKIKNNVTVTAPSKKLSSYKKVLTAKGLSKDTVFKKG